MRKSMIAALAATCAAFFQTTPAPSATHYTPVLQAFQCQDTDSTNVAQFVTQGTFEPLYLKTVVDGTSCGYEGAMITGISGSQFDHLYLQIQGTQDETGFGPYLRIYYNGGASVSQLAIHAGHVDGVFGGYTQRHYTAAEFGLTKSDVIDHMEIVANPASAEDGKCLIRQLHLNYVLANKTTTVSNSCP